MKQSVTVPKTGQGLKLAGVLNTLLAKIRLPKLELRALIRKLLVPLVSIVTFLGIWHLGSSMLRQREISFRVEKTLADQGESAANALQTCFDANGKECQTNTLPSPSQVWASVITLIDDH